MKEKMSIEKKTKLIYSGELILIALVAFTIGLLKILGVIDTKPTRLLVYNIITLAGGAFFIITGIRVIISKRARAKTSLLDKLLAMPVSLYLIAFDIICFVKGDAIDYDFVKYSIAIVLFYVAAIYIFEGIYHYHHLTPQLIEAIKEEEEELNKEKTEKIKSEETSENKEENK